jgi:hypothetical protein
MALEKIVKEDKIEIVGDYKIIQVRTATVIEEDGVQLSSSFHRHTVSPGQDISQESSEIQAICNAVHTPEVIAAWEVYQQEQQASESDSD